MVGHAMTDSYQPPDSEGVPPGPPAAAVGGLIRASIRLHAGFPACRADPVIVATGRGHSLASCG